MKQQEQLTSVVISVIIIFDNPSEDAEVRFIAGTPILMADSTSKPIEEIRPGDMVLAVDHLNPENDTPKPAKVTRFFDNGEKSVVQLTFDNQETGKSFELTCTPEHPFHVLGRGWVPAADLNTGDFCLSAEGKTVVFKNREELNDPQNVYNFEVEEKHTYFVGTTNSASVLAHNECPICGGTELISVPSIGVSYLSARGFAETPNCYLPVRCCCATYSHILGIKQKNLMLGDCYDSDYIRTINQLLTFSSKKTIVERYTNWVHLDEYTKTEIENKFHEINCGASVNHHTIYDAALTEYYGASGMGPCIGVVIYSKEGAIIAGFHFASDDYEKETLTQYKWLSDSVAVIAGGNDSQSSVLLLKRVLTTLNSLNIRILGVSPTDTLFCSSDGLWFTRKYNIGD